MREETEDRNGWKEIWRLLDEVVSKLKGDAACQRVAMTAIINPATLKEILITGTTEPLRAQVGPWKPQMQVHLDMTSFEFGLNRHLL